MLGVQCNLAITYCMLGRLEEALRLRQEVYSGRLRLSGEEHVETLVAADNYAESLATLKRFEEAKALLRKTVPVARRVLGENNEDTLKMRSVYADVLYFDPAATRDDLRESVETYEDIERIARRVLGDAHPLTKWIEDGLQDAQDVLYARGLP
jgi:tetratricopeptide (TPR) repeat protein